MKILDQHLFNSLDWALSQSLHHRQRKQAIIASNVANAQVPGYRARGYEFEEQLKTALQSDHPEQRLKTTSERHYRQEGVQEGSIQGDLFTRATESVAMDGNTVNVDQEMGELAENQILYRASVEALNRRWNFLRFVMHGGRS